ncbi:MAG: DUF2125 domain-containing protein [Pseudomonadota bacterium]
MRVILWAVILALLGWSGYWYITASVVEREAQAWFDERRSEGWQADFASLDTKGFPYRFDTVLTDVALADPGTGVVWSAPRFEVTALAYQPNHVIALFPPEQTLRSPFDTLAITNEDMRASVRVSGASMALAESRLDMSGLTARASSGLEVTLERGLLATRTTEDGPGTYDLFFEATNLRPSDTLRLGIDPQGRLPDTFETLKLQAEASFDAPWDRFAIERARPQPTRLDLKDFDAKWGQLELRAIGEVDIDSEGTPEGGITIKATNWREIISIGQALGTIPDGLVVTITSALEILASLSGPPNTIDIKLNFANGRMSLGPIPLGPAPTIRLR